MKMFLLSFSSPLLVASLKRHILLVWDPLPLAQEPPLSSSHPISDEDFFVCRSGVSRIPLLHERPSKCSGIIGLRILLPSPPFPPRSRGHSIGLVCMRSNEEICHIASPRALQSIVDPTCEDARDRKKVASLFHDILNANVLNRFRFFLRSSTSLIGKVVGREKSSLIPKVEPFRSQTHKERLPPFAALPSTWKFFSTSQN